MQAYRDLLNDLFKLVNKLNQAADEATQESESLKLRLSNVSLKQQVAALKQE